MTALTAVKSVAVPLRVRAIIRAVQPWLSVVQALVVTYAVGLGTVAVLGVTVKPNACGE